MNSIEKNGIRTTVVINMIMTIIYCVVFLTPFLARNISMFTQLGLMVIWFLSAIICGINSKIYRDKNVLWWLIYILLMFISTIIGHSAISINYHMAHLPIYIIPFIGIFILNKYNNKEISILIRIVIFIIFVNLLDNIYLGVVNPELFDEDMVLDGTREIVEKTTNAANTDMVSILTLLVPLCYIINKYSKSKNTKFFSLLMIISGIYYVVLINSRATALIVVLLTVAGFFLVETEPRNPLKCRRHYIWWSIASVVFIFVVAIPLMNFFIENLSGRNAERITDILTVTQGEDITMLNGSLSQRFLLDMASLNTFTSSIPNFLIGVGDDGGDVDLYSLIKSGVGQHSEIFDILARFGIVGGFIMFQIFKNLFENIRKRNLLHGKSDRFLTVIFCVFIFYNIVNRSLAIPMSLIVLYLFTPGVIQLLSYKKINNE
jgi:hypothetical protein